MADFGRIVNATITKYLKGEESNIMRQRRITAMLESKGRVKYNQSGRNIEERVEYKEIPMTGYADMDINVFQRNDTDKIAVIPIRGYSANDAISEFEKVINKGNEAIIQLVQTRAEKLKTHIENQFGRKFYPDGNASGNEKEIHGFKSATAVGGSATVLSGYESPNDTYMSLSTALGNYSGTWTGSWPETTGTSDADYDFWAPIIIDYTATGSPFSDGSTWATNAQQVIRAGIVRGQRSGLKDGMLDTIMVDGTMYIDFTHNISQDQRIEFQNASSPLRKMGFRDVLNYDGVDVTWEFDCPAAEGYGLNFDKMTLYCWEDMLFKPGGPVFDEVSATTRFWARFWGNFFFNPRFLVHWKAFGT